MTQSKTSLRKTYLKHRRALSETFQNEASQLICKKISEHPIYQQARHIALYDAIQREVNLSYLVPLPHQHFYLPIIQAHHELAFGLYDNQTRRHAFGMQEPIIAIPHLLSILDIIFIPFIAFDQHGHRLGYGQGYYDRLMPHQFKRIGIGYAMQYTESIPPDSWDQPLDMVFTEKKIFIFS